MSDSGKILQRFFKNAKYTDDEWEELEKMLADNQNTKVVCSIFNLKHSYYKAIKKHYNENGSIY